MRKIFNHFFHIKYMCRDIYHYSNKLCGNGSEFLNKNKNNVSPNFLGSGIYGLSKPSKFYSIVNFNEYKLYKFTINNPLIIYDCDLYFEFCHYIYENIDKIIKKIYNDDMIKNIYNYMNKLNINVNNIEKSLYNFYKEFNYGKLPFCNQPINYLLSYYDGIYFIEDSIGDTISKGSIKFVDNNFSSINFIKYFNKYSICCYYDLGKKYDYKNFKFEEKFDRILSDEEIEERNYINEENYHYKFYNKLL